MSKLDNCIGLKTSKPLALALKFEKIKVGAIGNTFLSLTWIVCSYSRKRSSGKFPNNTNLINREQLIAGAVLGEVFFIFFSTYVIALKLCIIYDILCNKSCQNRCFKCTQCSAVLRICWVCWELPKFTRIIGYWLNMDSLSIHRFQVQKTLGTWNLWILIELRFIP